MNARVTGLLVASGLAALVAEVVWTRALAAALGSEAHATAAVLGVYFAGLALGARLFGRRADRAERPLRLYAALEAAGALGGVWALVAARLAGEVAPRVSSGETVGLHGLVALVSATVAIAPATLALGGTFPAALRALDVAPGAQAARLVGRLGGANTLGGALGALAAGFVFLEALGVRGTAAVAIGLQLGCAALAAAWSRGTSAPTPAPAPETHSPAQMDSPRRGKKRKDAAAAAVPAAPEPAPAPAELRWPVLAMVLVGFASLLVEWIAFRVLAAAFGSTTYSFAAAVASYLVGSALAGAVLSRRPGRPLPWILGAPVFLVAWGFLAAHTTDLFSWLTGMDLGTGGAIPFARAVPAELALAAILLVPPAFVTTMLGSLLTAHAVRDAGTAGARVGAMQLGSALGCAAAPALAALVIIPLGGTKIALGVAAAALFLVTPLPAGLARRKILPLALLAGAGLFSLLPARLVHFVVSPGFKIVASGEGPLAAISIEEGPGGARRLRTNNRYLEGGDQSAFAERRQGHIPMLLRPGAKRALVLGLGTGITLGAVAAHGGEVDAVDLLPEIETVLGYFDKGTGGVTRNPRVHLHAADARSFVAHAAATGRRYDVVVGDLYHPQIAGTGALYAREHLARIRSLLAPGAIYVQWLPLYELGVPDLLVVLRTFGDVFAHLHAYLGFFNARTGLVGLVASNEPLVAPLDLPLAEAAARGGLADPAELAASFIAGRDELLRLAGPGPLNTDDRPLIEHGVPRHQGVTPAERTAALRALLAIRRLPTASEVRLAPDTSDRLPERKRHIDGMLEADLARIAP